MSWIKYAIVGGTTFHHRHSNFLTPSLMVLEPKPVTAKVIAGIVAVIVLRVEQESGACDRGGRERHHERCSLRSAAWECC